MADSYERMQFYNCKLCPFIVNGRSWNTFFFVFEVPKSKVSYHFFPDQKTMLMHEKMCPSLEKSDLIQVIIQDANGGKYKWFGTEIRKFLKSSITI